MSLESAIAAGKVEGKTALYFGCLDRIGHYLHGQNGRTIHRTDDLNFPWDMTHLDTGLLKNGKHPDVYNGKVFWTCGGLAFWYAFFWWDRSVDHRGAANSGFYVRGFGWPEEKEAFQYACDAFPRVVSRQRNPLVLQEK